MPNTIVVGDSVGLGISQALTGSTFAGGEGKRIDQMKADFNSAVAAAEKGDTVIISAGYNSTGPNGISAADVQSLQTFIDQLGEKGAKVVIVPLRETGMTGDYARLNGQTAKTNEQLRGLKGATVVEECIATANGIAGGEIHGAYLDLGKKCVDAAAKISTGAVTEGEKEATAADESKGDGWDIGGMLSGFVEKIKEFFSWLVDLVSGWFGGDEEPKPEAAPTPEAPKEEPAPSDPEKAKAAALEAAQGNSAGPATDVPAGDKVPGTSPAAGTDPLAKSK